jgi:hypothetical protein
LEFNARFVEDNFIAQDTVGDELTLGRLKTELRSWGVGFTKGIYKKFVNTSSELGSGVQIGDSI